MSIRWNRTDDVRVTCEVFFPKFWSFKILVISVNHESLSRAYKMDEERKDEWMNGLMDE